MIPRLVQHLSSERVGWFGAGLSDPAATRVALEQLLEFLRAGTPARTARPEYRARYERRRQTAELARVFDTAAGLPGAECGIGQDLSVPIPHSALRTSHSEIERGAS